MMKVQKPISRRGFLKIAAAGSAVGLTLKLGADHLLPTEPVSVTRLLMGTIVNLTVISPDRQKAASAVENCLDQMASLEAVLSRFDTNSQLSRLNQDSILSQAHPALLGLVTQANQISSLTQGAFDISVKPLVDLYQSRQDSDQGLPSSDLVQQTRQLVDYNAIQVSGDSIKFAKSQMTITLDGIAKGFIVDQGVSVLKYFGFDNVLVEAGGDLLASGQKEAQTPWNIGIQSPRKEKEGLLASFEVSNQAVATSGDYLQYYSADMKNHHIIDPRSGYSAPELASASVLAPSGAQADALATALMVLGPDAGMQCLKNFPDCQVYLVGKDMQVYSTITA
jgi:thiamine biosynthesis lipoprotein